MTGFVLDLTNRWIFNCSFSCKEKRCKVLIWFFRIFINIKIDVIHLTINEAKLVISGSGSENCRNPTNHVKQMAHSWKKKPLFWTPVNFTGCDEKQFQIARSIMLSLNRFLYFHSHVK